MQVRHAKEKSNCEAKNRLARATGIFPIASARGVESYLRMTNTPVDLRARARQAMVEAGFHPDFPAEVTAEVQSLKNGAPKGVDVPARDLRALLWSSIDNDTS